MSPPLGPTTERVRRQRTASLEPGDLLASRNRSIDGLQASRPAPPDLFVGGAFGSFGKRLARRHSAPARLPLFVSRASVVRRLLAEAFGSEGARGDVAAWRALAPCVASSLLEPPFDFEHVLGYAALPLFNSVRVALMRELVQAVQQADPRASAPRRLVAVHTVLAWAEARYPEEAGLIADKAALEASLSTKSARACLMGQQKLRDPPFIRARVLELVDAGLLHELASAFLGSESEGTPETWWPLAAEAAASCLRHPEALALVLQCLDSGALKDQQRVIACEFVALVAKQAAGSLGPESIVVQHAVWSWASARYPRDPGLKAAKHRLLGCGPLRTAEGRARLQASAPPARAKALAAPLKKICQQARGHERDERIAALQAPWVIGAWLAGGHVLLGAALAAGNLVAWFAGCATCFELAALLVVFGVAIAAGEMALYAVLWTYHHAASWQSGRRENSARPGPLA